MPDIFLSKTANNFLRPCDEDAHRYIKSLDIGQDIRCKVTKARNLKFHRKYMALLRHAFECFEPQDVEIPAHIAAHGITPEKNFDRFRKDIAILSGFYTASIRVNGDIQMEAKSIAFANMSEDEFAVLYNKTIDTILKYVLKNYSKDDLELVVQEVLEYA